MEELDYGESGECYWTDKEVIIQMKDFIVECLTILHSEFDFSLFCRPFRQAQLPSTGWFEYE